jgi:hypothetical protein
MMKISHNGTPLTKTKASKLLSPVLGYLKGCHRQGQEWMFDQLAKFTHGALLFLAGVISEAKNWF